MKKKDIFLICIGAFLISFSFGLFLSIPLFIEHIGGNESKTGFLLGISGIGAIAAVFLSKFLFKKIQSKCIAALGGVCYFIGSLSFILVHEIGFSIYVDMIILGIGWGFYFNAAPYTLSLFAADKNRSALFSYLSAFSVLGTGIAPVAIKYIWRNVIHFNGLFIIASLTGIISSLAFCFVTPKTNKITGSVLITKESYFLDIFKSTAIYPILMVFLGACAFTMMLNFQTTFSNSIGMNYAFFYFTYSLAVVISRLTLGQHLARFNQYRICIILLALMTVALLSFLLSNYGIVFYGVSSALFGISYGLAYPTIQAIAVNISPEKYRSDVISYFSLSYFIGVYAFPPIGGLLIVHFGYKKLICLLSLLAAMELALSCSLYKKIKRGVNDKIYC